MADAEAQEKFLAERAKMKTQYESVRRTDRGVQAPLPSDGSPRPNSRGVMAVLLQELSPVSGELLRLSPHPLLQFDVPRCHVSTQPHCELITWHSPLCLSPTSLIRTSRSYLCARASHPLAGRFIAFDPDFPPTQCTHPTHPTHPTHAASHPPPNLTHPCYPRPPRCRTWRVPT